MATTQKVIPDKATEDARANRKHLLFGLTTLVILGYAMGLGLSERYAEIRILKNGQPATAARLDWENKQADADGWFRKLPMKGEDKRMFFLGTPDGSGLGVTLEPNESLTIDQLIAPGMSSTITKTTRRGYLFGFIPRVTTTSTIDFSEEDIERFDELNLSFNQRHNQVLAEYKAAMKKLNSSSNED